MRSNVLEAKFNLNFASLLSVCNNAFNFLVDQNTIIVEYVSLFSLLFDSFVYFYQQHKAFYYSQLEQTTYVDNFLSPPWIPAVSLSAVQLSNNKVIKKKAVKPMHINITCTVALFQVVVFWFFLAENALNL